MCSEGASGSSLGLRLPRLRHLSANPGAAEMPRDEPATPADGFTAHLQRGLTTAPGGRVRFSESAGPEAVGSRLFPGLFRPETPVMSGISEGRFLLTSKLGATELSGNKCFYLIDGELKQ